MPTGVCTPYWDLLNALWGSRSSQRIILCVCVELLYRRAAPSKERPGKKFTGLSCLLLKEKIFYFCFIWTFLVRGALLGKNGRVLACDEALCGFTGEAVGMLRHIIRSHSDCKIIIIKKKICCSHLVTEIVEAAASWSRLKELGTLIGFKLTAPLSDVSVRNWI